VLVYVKLHVESVSVFSASQKFMCVCCVCGIKSSGNKKNKNRILGLEIYAVAKEAL